MSNSDNKCKQTVKAEQIILTIHHTETSLASRVKEYVHQLNFPLRYQPRACDFYFHPNQNFSSRECEGVITRERSEVLAEMEAEGKENLRGR